MLRWTLGHTLATFSSTEVLLFNSAYKTQLKLIAPFPFTLSALTSVSVSLWGDGLKYLCIPTTEMGVSCSVKMPDDCWKKGQVLPRPLDLLSHHSREFFISMSISFAGFWATRGQNPAFSYFCFPQSTVFCGQWVLGAGLGIQGTNTLPSLSLSRANSHLLAS